MYQRSAELHAPGDIVAHWRPSLSRRSSFLQLHRLGGVRVTEYRATIPCDIHGDFEIFKSRVSLLLQLARSQSELAIRARSHRPASDIRLAYLYVPRRVAARPILTRVGQVLNVTRLGAWPIVASNAGATFIRSEDASLLRSP